MTRGLFLEPFKFFPQQLERENAMVFLALATSPYVAVIILTVSSRMHRLVGSFVVATDTTLVLMVVDVGPALDEESVGVGGADAVGVDGADAVGVDGAEAAGTAGGGRDLDSDVLNCLPSGVIRSQDPARHW